MNTIQKKKEQLVVLSFFKKLEETTLEQVMSLGEDATDLLYKSVFAAECLLPVVDAAGTMCSSVPGIGVGATAILLAMKTKQAVQACSKHQGDLDLEAEIEDEEEVPAQLLPIAMLCGRLPVSVLFL